MSSYEYGLIPENGLFYAYARSTHNNWEARVTLIFADRDTADRWWRGIWEVKKSNPNSIFASVERRSPQFYVYDYSKVKLSQTLDQTQAYMNQYLTGARDKVIISANTNLWGYGGSQGPFDILPVQNIVDRVSGGVFSIRDKTDPSKSWFADDKHVHVSTTQRTKFRIWTVDSSGPNSTPGNPADQRIMLPEDKVYIALAYRPTPRGGLNFVTVEQSSGPDEDRLILSHRSEEWTLGKLLNNVVSEDVTNDAANKDKEKINLVTAPGADNFGGDSWTLAP